MKQNKATAQDAEFSDGKAPKPEPPPDAPGTAGNNLFRPIRPLPSNVTSSALPYRMDMLPDALRPWLADIAERGQFQFDFLAVAAMAALGSAVGRRCAVYPKQRDDWHEYPNLWAAIIGRPGAMKSPSLNAVLSPLRAIEGMWSSEYQAELATFQDTKFVHEVQAGAAKKLARSLAEKGEKFGPPGMDAPVEPVCRRLLTSDPTEAKLGELLSQNPMGITMELDELAVLNAMFEREPSLREFCLKGWSAKDCHTIDRIGRGTLRIEALCLSVIGGIQPGRIAPIVKTAMQGQGGDGLLQRFQLIAWPSGWDEPWRHVDRYPDSRAKEDARDLFERLVEMKPSDFPTAGEFGPHGLRFTADAQVLFNDWHGKLHASLRSAALPEALEASLAKGAKAVAGIALLCELADNPLAGAIGPDALEMALEWRKVAESHTAKMFSISEQTEADAARLIWKRVEAGDLNEGFTAREVKRRHWSGLSDSAEVDAGLAILAETGHLRADKIESGGRPSHSYAINPEALKK